MDIELRAAAQRLAQEFDGRVQREVVDQIVESSYDELSASARTASFLPLLTERFARERLQALTKIDHDRARTKAVLFLCVHNAGRSQMALGWFNHLAQGRAIAWSGGSEPGNEVNPAAIDAMREVGIDITQEYPKPWTEEILRAADVVVTMGCGDECPYYPGTRYEDWALDDPAGQGIDAVRPIRDEIRNRVVVLLKELGVEVIE